MSLLLQRVSETLSSHGALSQSVPGFQPRQGQTDMAIAGRRVTRLMAVKKVIGDFVVRRNSDRMGLILFGAQAYLQAPLTYDRKTVNQLLQEVIV